MTRLFVVLFFALCFSLLAAQESAPALVNADEIAASSEVLESRLKEIEGDSGLDDVIKKSLGDRYREALDSLQQAVEFRALEAEYRQALEKGPGETLRIRSEIDANTQKSDPADAFPQGLTEPFSNDDLESAVARERVALTTLNTELEDLGSRLSELRTRPSQISERRIAAQSELTATLVQLRSAEEAAASDLSSLGNRAEVDRLQSLREKLSAEIAMLEQEDLSDEIRMATTEAARDLAELKIGASEKTIAALRELATTLLTDRVRQAEALVAEIREQSPDASAEMRGLVEDLKLVISETHEVSGAIRANEALSQEREAERKRITEAFNNARRQSELGVLEGTLAKVIMEQIRTLPTQRNGKQRLAATQSETEKARRGIVELDRRVRAQEIEAQVGRSDSGRFEAEIDSIRETRESLQSDLRSSYRRWIRDLGELDLAERQIVAESQAFRDFAAEKLFWVRSSPGIGLQTFSDLGEGLAYCYGPKRLAELGEQVAAIPIWIYLLAGGILAALLIPRRFFCRTLRESGLQTKRISTDRYTHTLSAFLMTLLLAAPAAVAISLAGWALMRQPDATEWSFGLGFALLTSAGFLFLLSFVIVLCRKEGLGTVHFQWDSSAIQRIRRLAFWLIPVHLLVTITLILVVSEPGISHLNGLGRMTLLMAVTGFGIVGALMLQPGKGIAASVHRIAPNHLFGRLRRFWFFLAVAAPVLVVALLLGGWVFTALLLAQQAKLSVGAIVLAFIVYGLAWRWFAIKERKLALKEALEERETRREAAEREAEAASEVAESHAFAEDGLIPEIQKEEGMDLTEVGEQTRKLIGFLVGVGLLMSLWLIWTEFAPVLNVLDKFEFFWGISIADVAVIILVIAVTVSTTRNLPGLLEVAILRPLDLDAGTRNSIITLAKYAVMAIGAMVLFRNLGVDWSKLGWIAAALSVGIGFGLQEVVANFISGIILLFERPVRVGDVVTVDGIDGVVSRIQIRATTITNWDRKELIIPNKNFITGTVLNWTLSNAVNRIVIVVGVAYGSDTEKARQILIDVAHEHPRVLDDPPSLATFEAFADSSLTLRLRCYVPDMEGRVLIITDLHTEIDKRFKEAGIEIAFPQQDLHLRSVDPGVHFGTGSGVAGVDLTQTGAGPPDFPMQNREKAFNAFSVEATSGDLC